MPSLSIRQWILIAVIAAILLLLFRFCSDDDTDPYVAEAESEYVLEPPYFVEIVVELLPYPFRGEPGSPIASSQPNHYVFDPLVSPKPLLFTALGEVSEKRSEYPLWVGLNQSSWLQDHDGYKLKTLEYSEKPEWELETTQELFAQQLITFGLDASLFSRKNISIEVKDNKLYAKTGWTTTELRPGDHVVIYQDDFSVSQQEKLDTIFDILDDFDEEVDEVTAESSTDDTKVYLQISAVFHGAINLGDVDILREHTTYKKSIKDGPYEKALAALEKLLLVDPADKRTLEKWLQVDELLGGGVRASVIKGEIVHKALPMNSSLGTASSKPVTVGLAMPGDPEDILYLVQEVDGGIFEFYVPSGRYELRFMEGRSTTTKIVDVDGEIEVRFEVP